MAPKLSASRQIDQILETAKGKSYAVTGVTVLLVVLIVLVGIFPAISAIIFQISENNSRQEALDQVNAKREILVGLVEEEQEKRAVSLALNNYLPNEISQQSVYDVVNQVLLSGVDVDVLAIRFSDIDERRRLSSVFDVDIALSAKSLNISLAGSREEILKFTTALENSYRIINIRSLSVFTEQDEEETGLFRAEIQAEFYYWQTSITDE